MYRLGVLVDITTLPGSRTAPNDRAEIIVAKLNASGSKGSQCCSNNMSQALQALHCTYIATHAATATLWSGWWAASAGSVFCCLCTLLQLVVCLAHSPAALCLGHHGLAAITGADHVWPWTPWLPASCPQADEAELACNICVTQQQIDRTVLSELAHAETCSEA